MTPIDAGPRFGVSFGALYEPADAVVALGAEAEAGGFADLWVPDSPALYRDPYATLALLARATRQARLGTLATNPLTRHPAVTASAILTIQELSGGRACLGIATGDSAVRRLGAAPARLAELEAAIRLMRRLTAGSPSHAVEGVTIRFAAGPPVPILVVASGLRTLELAGRVADGVVLNVGVHPHVLAAALDRIHAGARAAGRDPATIEVIVFAFCAIHADRAVAAARLAPSVSWLCQRFPDLCALAGLALDSATCEALSRFDADYARYDLVHAGEWAQAVQDAAFLSRDYVDAFALGGPAADVAARLRELVRLGHSRVSIRPPSREDWRATVRAFAADVIPAVGGAHGVPSGA